MPGRADPKDDEIVRELEWANAHYEVLHPDFEGMWIAIDHGRIIAAGAGLDVVRAEASGALGRPPAEIAVTFVERENCVYGQAAAIPPGHALPDSGARP